MKQLDENSVSWVEIYEMFVTGQGNIVEVIGGSGTRDLYNNYTFNKNKRTMKRILFTLLVCVACINLNAQNFKFQDLHGIWIVSGAYVQDEYGNTTLTTVDDAIGFALTGYKTTDVDGMYHSIFMAGDSKLRLPYKFEDGNMVKVYVLLDGILEKFATIEILSLIPKTKMVGRMSIEGGTTAKLDFTYIEPNE